VKLPEKRAGVKPSPHHCDIATPMTLWCKQTVLCLHAMFAIRLLVVGSCQN
jgi:hypothetical protein